MMKYSPYVIGGIIGAVVGPLMAIYLPFTTGALIFGALGAILGVLWATNQAVKAASRHYGT